MKDFTCVVAVLNGHDHFGGYCLDDNGVHHLTFPSPLNCGSSNLCHGHVDVFDDRLEIVGKGLVKSMCLKFKNKQANL